MTIHLVVETTGVAEIVPVAVPPPERGGGGAAVDALAALWKKGEEKRGREGFTTSLTLSSEQEWV